ncbi:hypothetical protein LQ567_01500 [Niabella pedocola]|uniref:WxL domain-containing protein n=1 Tax=Niabella pedocola TaxID=1752077 RepID=A0ABS8PK16_9BACT|nr:hypothetical protein [Niabella pedocola]MCD2421419.1 hypothetical protein [Niabella pedocola]
MTTNKLHPLAVAFLLFLGIASSTANAQPTTGTTNLHVVINPLLSITVQQPDVTLAFTTLADYQNGVTTPMTGHLLITSILPYTVSLAANAATLAGTGGNTQTVNAAAVSVTAPATANNTNLPGSNLQTIAALSTTPAPLIGGSYALAAPADVTYSVPQANVATQILGKAPDTYTVALTYSITNP